MVKEMIKRKDDGKVDVIRDSMEDPFNMNVMFYDGMNPINDFKSKREFIDRELQLE